MSIKCNRRLLKFTKWSRLSITLTRGVESDHLRGSDSCTRPRLTHTRRQRIPHAHREFILSLLIHTLSWPDLSAINFSCNPCSVAILWFSTHNACCVFPPFNWQSLRRATWHVNVSTYHSGEVFVVWGYAIFTRMHFLCSSDVNCMLPFF